MASFTNPPGGPSVVYNGRITYSDQELADACRMWGGRLQVPAGLDGPRLLWAIAGRESSFAKDCRPRHEKAYCTGKYGQHTEVLKATKLWGHRAHCSFGPWQMLYVNDHTLADPELFTDIQYAACRTTIFLNSEILGHQKASTLTQIADAYNSGNYRDNIVPADYIAAIKHNYLNVPMPAQTLMSIKAAACDDAGALYQDLCDAIEVLGMGFHPGALVGVPLQLEVDGKVREITRHGIQWSAGEQGKKIDRLILTAE